MKFMSQAEAECKAPADIHYRGWTVTDLRVKNPNATGYLMDITKGWRWLNPWHKGWPFAIQQFATPRETKRFIDEVLGDFPDGDYQIVKQVEAINLGTPEELGRQADPHKGGIHGWLQPIKGAICDCYLEVGDIVRFVGAHRRARINGKNIVWVPKWPWNPGVPFNYATLAYKAGWVEEVELPESLTRWAEEKRRA